MRVTECHGKKDCRDLNGAGEGIAQYAHDMLLPFALPFSDHTMLVHQFLI